MIKPLLCEGCQDGRAMDNRTLAPNGPCHLCGANGERLMMLGSLVTDERLFTIGRGLADAREKNEEGPSVPPEVLRDLIAEVNALRAYVLGAERLRQARSAPGKHELAAIMSGGE